MGYDEIVVAEDVHEGFVENPNQEMEGAFDIHIVDDDFVENPTEEIEDSFNLQYIGAHNKGHATGLLKLKRTIDQL
ncbi:hypothetical protein E3N88_10653 [Mikania micrantha]|uniref:Uncharacterized protein n=1 Tax=Mikania micrantha TaxID=192012 RepID=A0A5N6PD00_9ASTR|nr:hypothetical protein E3N88_10653 [Mikania micrantha]